MHRSRPPARTPLPSPSSTAPPLPRPALVLALGQALFLAVVPGGGQRLARRNAWSAMSADVAHGRVRREADAALEAAGHRTPRPVDPARGRVRVVRSG